MFGMRWTGAALTLLLLAAVSFSAYGKKHPELGDVTWLRNYDTAEEEARVTGKPLLILFQEVPGCSGCVNYGQETLRHPTIVEVIEQHFVPLAIFNNQGGHDREILKRFKEPAWNFQVMRFIDPQGRDILPRKDGVWSVEETAQRMAEALEAIGKPVPEALRNLTSAGEVPRHREAAFAMYCFWEGEAKLGGIDGVLLTEAGFLDGREVVRLTYDAELIRWPDLVRQAHRKGCASHVYGPDATTISEKPDGIGISTSPFDQDAYRKARMSDQKRHLRHSKLARLDLSPLQETKVNAALSRGDTEAIRMLLNADQLDQLRELEREHQEAF